jgi:DNA-binding transcriptional ArsR family regulator
MNAACPRSSAFAFYDSNETFWIILESDSCCNRLLELRHLKTLKALREAGNLSRAAQLLNLTQSALSHQLKAAGGRTTARTLFERKSVPVQFRHRRPAVAAAGRHRAAADR